MIRNIYKYELRPNSNTILSLPHGAKVLCVKNQCEKIMLYASFERDIGGTVDRSFHALPTGEDIYGSEGDYIDTVLTHSGSLVWHIYESR